MPNPESEGPERKTSIFSFVRPLTESLERRQGIIFLGGLLSSLTFVFTVTAIEIIASTQGVEVVSDSFLLAAGALPIAFAIAWFLTYKQIQ